MPQDSAPVISGVRCHPRTDFAVVGFLIALWAVTFLPRLGEREVTSIIEARVGITAREMWRAGEWILPTFNGAPRLQKPPLAYWVVEALASLRGACDDLTLRLPFALLALGSVLFTWRMGHRLGGASQGLAAGVILLTSALFVQGGRTASADIALLFGVTGAWYFYLTARLTEHRGCRVLLWGFLAVGGLAKGPVVLAVVLLPAVLEALVARSWRPLVPLGSGVGVALFLGLSLWWPAAVIWRLSDQLPAWQAVHRWFLESFGKILPSDGIDEGYKFQRHAGPVYFYLLRFPGVLGFWVVALIPWLQGLVGQRGWRSFASRLRRGDPTVLPALWVLTTLVFFSLVSEKKTPYILPVLPAASLWLAGALARAGDGWRRFLDCLAPMLGALALLAVGMMAWAVFHGVPGWLEVLLPSAWRGACERVARDHRWPALALGILGVCLGGVLPWSLRRATAVPVYLLVGGILGLGGYFYELIRDDLEPPTAFRHSGESLRSVLAETLEPIALGNLPAGLLYYCDRIMQVRDAKQVDAVANLPRGSTVLLREKVLEHLGVPLPDAEGVVLAPPLEHFEVRKLIDAGSGSARDRVLVLGGK